MDSNDDKIGLSSGVRVGLIKVGLSLLMAA